MQPAAAIIDDPSRDDLVATPLGPDIPQAKIERL